MMCIIRPKILFRIKIKDNKVYSICTKYSIIYTILATHIAALLLHCHYNPIKLPPYTKEYCKICRTCRVAQLRASEQWNLGAHGTCKAAQQRVHGTVGLAGCGGTQGLQPVRHRQWCSWKVHNSVWYNHQGGVDMCKGTCKLDYKAIVSGRAACSERGNYILTGSRHDAVWHSTGRSYVDMAAT